MNHKFDVSGKVVAVISGGNIDVTMISRIIEKGLLRAGRVTKLRILMQDRPGQLEMASRIIAAEGANVMVVHHDRTDVDLDIRDAILEITMETQDREHAQRVTSAARGRLQGFVSGDERDFASHFSRKTEPSASLIALQSGTGKAFLYIKRSCQA